MHWVAALDLSELIIVSCLNDERKPRYGGKLRVLYTDTDSFVFEINTRTGTLTCLEMYTSTTDTHDFENEPLREVAAHKKKKHGLMSDAVGGKVIHSSVGLKPKMYSINNRKEPIYKKDKGNRKSVTKNITHQHYWKVVQGGKNLYHTNVGFHTTAFEGSHAITTSTVKIN